MMWPTTQGVLFGIATFLILSYCLGIQGKANHQRPTVYNLVGIGNINFDHLRSLTTLSILDLGGVGQRTMVPGRRLPLATQHDLACCAAQSAAGLGQLRQIDDARGASAAPPIAAEWLHCGLRCKSAPKWDPG